jgi:hypothetical protein
MNWKRLLACITGSVDQELLLCNKSLATEDRILRNPLKGRLHLADNHRLTRAEIGKRRMLAAVDFFTVELRRLAGAALCTSKSNIQPKE